MNTPLKHKDFDKAKVGDLFINTDSQFPVLLVVIGVDKDKETIDLYDPEGDVEARYADIPKYWQVLDDWKLRLNKKQVQMIVEGPRSVTGFDFVSY